jgi:hypothetical protein
MRRHLLTLALAGLFGAFLTADAQACHKKKCTPACAPVACAPAPVCEPCPPPPPPPVCEPCPTVCETPKKKCGLFGGHKLKMGGLFHHKKAACAPAAVAYTTWAPAPSPQVYSSGQAHPSGQ